MHKSPNALMDALIVARSTNTMNDVIQCYEPTALIAVEPGTFLSGLDVIRNFNEAVSKLNITFTGRSILEGDGVAIHYATWLRSDTVSGPSSIFTGVTTDVLRRQADGSWLICIDNPWGWNSGVAAK